MPKFNTYSDPELEQKVLAACIQSPEPFALLDTLQSHYFTNEVTRDLFTVIKGLSLSIGVLPTEAALKLELQNRYINSPQIIDTLLTTYTQLQSLPIDVPPSFLVKNLINFARAREMLSSIDRAVAKLSEGDIEGAIKDYQADALSLQASDPVVTVSRGEFLEEVNKRKELLEDIKLHPEKYRGIPTGIEELDELTQGLWRGELGFVFGRTGIGKSFFLLEVALAAFKYGCKVLVVTVEMPKTQWERRLDSRVSHVPYAHFKRASLDEIEYKQWERSLEHLKSRYYTKGARLWVTHIPFGCTVGSIRAEIEYYRGQGTPVDIVVMDYGDLITPSRHLFSEQAELTSIFRELKGLAQLYNIPVWTASQSKVGTYRSAKLDVEDVGYAAGKAHVSDLVVGISCTDEDQLAGRMSLHVVKYRDGVASKPITLKPKFEISMIDSKGV